MRCFIEVECVALTLEVPSAEDGMSFTLGCNDVAWQNIHQSSTEPNNDGKTKAPVLKGEVRLYTPDFTEPNDICVNGRFPLPWSQDNGRTLMSCVTAEATEGVVSVNLNDLDCPLVVVHDLFELLAQQKYSATKGL